MNDRRTAESAALAEAQTELAALRRRVRQMVEDFRRSEEFSASVLDSLSN